MTRGTIVLVLVVGLVLVLERDAYPGFEQTCH
jgi:hypothetical protein